jgi:hypothetical protein
MLRVVAELESGEAARIVGKSPGGGASGRASRPAPTRPAGRTGGCNAMSGPDTMRGEMPGFPSQAGPAASPTSCCWTCSSSGAPCAPVRRSEMHDLARMLATLDGPAEPGELAGEAEALAALVAGVAGTAAAYAGALPDPVQQVAQVMVGAPAPHHGGPQRRAVPAPRPDTQPALRPAGQPGPGQNDAGETAKARARPSPPGRVTGQPKATTGRPAAALTTRRQARTSQGADRTIQASQRRRRHAAWPPRPAIGRPVTEARTAASFRLKDS